MPVSYNARRDAHLPVFNGLSTPRETLKRTCLLCRFLSFDWPVSERVEEIVRAIQKEGEGERKATCGA